MPVLTFSSFLGFQNRKFGGGAVAQFASKLLFCEVGDTGAVPGTPALQPPNLHFLGLTLSTMRGGFDVLLPGVGGSLVVSASGELTHPLQSQSKAQRKGEAFPAQQRADGWG